MSFWVYESPKWLLEKGKNEKALEIFFKIAKRNKVTTFKGLEIKKNASEPLLETQNEKNYSVFLLFKSPEIFVVCASFLITAICGYGILFSVGNISGDLALNFIIMMSFTMCLCSSFPLMDRYISKFGRKLSHQLGLWGVVIPCTLITVENHK